MTRPRWLLVLALAGCAWPPEGDSGVGETDEPPAVDSDSADDPLVEGPLVVDHDGDGFPVTSECDDDDPDVFPGAIDICGDGLASDCGVGPPCRYDGEWSLANAHRIVGTRSGEEAGEVIAAAGDTNGDGLADFLSYSQGGAGVNIVLGPATITTFQEAAASVSGTFHWRAPVGAGDVDADGLADLLVTTRDASYLLAGPFSGSMTADASAVAYIPFLTSEAARTGDWTGDGYDDLAYSWVEGSQGTESWFAVAAGPLRGALEPEDANFVVAGTYGGPGIEGIAGAGDVDGDGLQDLLAISSTDSTNARASGAARLFYGGQSGQSVLDDAEALLAGVNEEEEAGYSYDAAGDVNADGYDDVLIGSFARDVNWGYEVNQTAVASLVYGPVHGKLDLDEADARYECDVEPVSCAAARVRGAGDMDGDGFYDFAVANPVGWRRDGSHGGAWLFYGPVEGHHTIDVAEAALVGDVPVNVGVSIDGVGDLDGDGLDDIVLGTPWWRESAESPEYDVGAAYVVFGGAL